MTRNLLKPASITPIEGYTVLEFLRLMRWLQAVDLRTSSDLDDLQDAKRLVFIRWMVDVGRFKR